MTIHFPIILAAMTTTTLTSLPPPEPDGPIHHLACVGDGWTFGEETPARDFASYPAQLQRMLGSEWSVGNFGVSTASLTPENKPYQEQVTFQKALSFRPDTVVILFGDPGASTQQGQSATDEADLIRKFQALHPTPKIYLGLLSKSPAGKPPGGEPSALLRAAATATGATVIELGDRLPKESPPSNPDHFEQATLLARAVYKAVTGREFAGAVPEIGKSTWQGYAREDFLAGGRASLVVIPRKSLPGRPWIWRTEFFGAYPAADIALLAKGYHIAYTNMQNLYGGPEAMTAMDKFFDHITKNYGLAPKVVLEGFSRGGLYAFNWAARHPDKVAAMYVDAPVCDFKSWPAGKGKGNPSPQDWARCLHAYGLTETEALRYPLNPVDNLKAIARAKIPIIAVAGEADRTVPINENILLVEKRYRALGGEIQVIVKPGVDHHPHSLTDPSPIVDFLLAH